MDLPAAYVELALGFDRLVPGLVDGRSPLTAYAGTPAELANRARVLLAELASAGLPAPRAGWLRAQLVALETSGRVLGGEPVGFVDQVEAYCQIRPELRAVEVYAGAHTALAELLPGPEPLADRLAAYRDRTACPPALLPAALAAVSELLRTRSLERYPLPAGEGVAYDVVSGRPWSGLTRYLGAARSVVTVNADLVGLGSLPALVAHEAYPGHHTERSRKEAVRATRPEHDVSVVNTPECLLAEGLAEHGLRGAGLPTGWGALAQGCYAALGIAWDGAHGEAVAQALGGLSAVSQDAALLLHDRGCDQDEVIDHLVRWGLQSPARARRSLAFLVHPLWRAYITTYVEGERLVGAWLDRDEGRFARLLDEPLTPAELVSSLG